MEIEFDPNKSQKNADERGLPFDLVHEFNWESALIIQDTRYAYPEARFVATGYIGNRIHTVCYTPIEDGIRVISFRKSNEKEVARYVEQITDR